MQNINEKIFEQTLLLWRGVLTRTSFPQTYDSLKAYITNEYSSQMTQTDRVKVIYGVISTHQKKKTELSMLADEDEKKDKDKCHICDRKGHKWRKYWYYDANKMLKQNRKEAAEKINVKLEAKKKKQDEAKKDETDKGKSNKKSNKDKWVPHKGTQAQLPPKTEHNGMCLDKDASLYCEPCFAMGVHPGQVDFIYDSGTVSGVMGEREMNILKNVAQEDVLIETITGERSISKLYGDTIFGKSRILNGRRGSVLVSQYATRSLYQVLNPNKDTFILKGWDHNPKTKGKLWYFVRDKSRYNDKLLHCTVDLKTAKSFGVKEKLFYDPPKTPESEKNARINDIVDTIHIRFQHASANEMQNIIQMDCQEFNTLKLSDIDRWLDECGKFCTGCAEGKLKEHARVKSTKPLASQIPGEVTVGDIMFIEMKNNVKKPLMLNVDVCTKMITGVSLKNKSEEECTNRSWRLKETIK
jgi:hypothetical protein